MNSFFNVAFVVALGVSFAVVMFFIFNVKDNVRSDVKF